MKFLTALKEWFFGKPETQVEAPTAPYKVEPPMEEKTPSNTIQFPVERPAEVAPKVEEVKAEEPKAEPKPARKTAAKPRVAPKTTTAAKPKAPAKAKAPAKPRVAPKTTAAKPADKKPATPRKKKTAE